MARRTNGTAYAAIYARVSSEEQTRGCSLETQVESCMALAAQQGCTVRPEYTFLEDYPGAALRRPKLDMVRDLVRDGLVQAVIVHDLDRLSRKLAHQILLREELEKAHVRLFIVLMPEDEEQTPEQKLLSNVRGVIAEYERAKIEERTSRGRLARYKAGYPPATAPIGYRYIKYDKTPDNPHGRGGYYVIVEEEAAIVRRIFTLYVERRLPFERIAEILTAERHATKGAHLRRLWSVTQWHPESVRAILTSETYVGTMFYGKRERVEGKKNPGKNTRKRAVPREKWIPIAVPPIIDEDVFKAAQAQIQRNRQASRRNRRHEYLLVAGRLRCGQCGCKMHGCRPNDTSRGYRCLQPRYRRAPHTKSYVMADTLESQVWAAIERALRNPTLIAAEIERRTQQAGAQEKDIDKDCTFYLEQLAQCDRTLEKWERAYLSDVFTLEEFKTRKAEVDAKRASLQAELVKLDEQRQRIEQTHVETATLKEYCQRVARNLKNFDLSEKRLACEALNIQVIWYPDKPLEIQGSISVSVEKGSPCGA